MHDLKNIVPFSVFSISSFFGGKISCISLFLSPPKKPLKSDGCSLLFLFTYSWFVLSLCVLSLWLLSLLLLCLLTKKIGQKKLVFCFSSSHNLRKKNLTKTVFSFRKYLPFLFFSILFHSRKAFLQTNTWFINFIALYLSLFKKLHQQNPNRRGIWNSKRQIDVVTF